MIRGLVKQQDIRRLDQRFHNGEPLLPSSRQCCRFGIQVFEARPAQGLGKMGAVFRIGIRRIAEGPIDYGAHAFARLEL